MAHVGSQHRDRESLDVLKSHGSVPRKSFVLGSNFSGAVLKLPWGVSEDCAKSAAASKRQQVLGRRQGNQLRGHSAPSRNANKHLNQNAMLHHRFCVSRALLRTALSFSAQKKT